MSGILSTLLVAGGGPKQPKNVVASTYTSTGFTLSWDDDPTITTYTVSGNSTLLANPITLAGSTRSTVIDTTSYTANTGITFVVKASNVSGSSMTLIIVYSNPTAPTGITASSFTASGLTLTWTAVAGLTYTIRQDMPVEPAGTPISTQVPGTISATGTVISNLHSNTGYTYYISATNSTGVPIVSAGYTAITATSDPVINIMTENNLTATVDYTFDSGINGYSPTPTFSCSPLNSSESPSLSLTAKWITVSSISNGWFSCTSAPIALGSKIGVLYANTGTGAISGYGDGSNWTWYYVSETNGSTTFKLSATKYGNTVPTTDGAVSGMQFYLYFYQYSRSTGLVSGTSYQFQVKLTTTSGVTNWSSWSNSVMARKVISYTVTSGGYTIVNSTIGYNSETYAVITLSLSGALTGWLSMQNSGTTYGYGLGINISLGTGATLTVNNSGTIEGYLGTYRYSASGYSNSSYMGGGHGLVVWTPCIFNNYSYIYGGGASGGIASTNMGWYGGQGGSAGGYAVISYGTSTVFHNYGIVYGGGGGGGASGGWNSTYGGPGGGGGVGLYMASGTIYNHQYANIKGGGGGGGGTAKSTSSTSTGISGGSGNNGVYGKGGGGDGGVYTGTSYGGSPGVIGSTAPTYRSIAGAGGGQPGSALSGSYSLSNSGTITP